VPLVALVKDRPGAGARRQGFHRLLAAIAALQVFHQLGLIVGGQHAVEHILPADAFGTESRHGG
jgi:hypothetical protein